MLYYALFRLTLCKRYLSFPNYSASSLSSSASSSSASSSSSHRSFCRYYLVNSNGFKLLNNNQHTNNYYASKRYFNNNLRIRTKSKNNEIAHYAISLTIGFLALSYASAPLYRIYCQATGKGGRAVVTKTEEKIAKMNMNKERTINVNFVADTNSRMAWNFKPTQNVIQVLPGETALAFYTAKNPLNRPVIGVATYNVMPYEAGLYFNKIQCFCFEEQMLNPNEEIDLPVFFYIDPEFANDPRLEQIKDIILSYTFFEARESTKWSKFFGRFYGWNKNK